MIKKGPLLVFSALCFAAAVVSAQEQQPPVSEAPHYTYPGPPSLITPSVPCGEEYDNLVDKKGIAKKVFIPGGHQVLCIDEESDIVDRQAIANKVFGRRASRHITVDLASSDFEFLKLYLGTSFSVKLKQEPGSEWKYSALHWIDDDEPSEENPVKDVASHKQGNYLIMDFATLSAGYTYLYFDKFVVTKDGKERVEGRAIRARIQKPKSAAAYIKRRK